MEKRVGERKGVRVSKGVRVRGRSRGWRSMRGRELGKGKVLRVARRMVSTLGKEVGIGTSYGVWKGRKRQGKGDRESGGQGVRGGESGKGERLGEKVGGYVARYIS